jgi:hypothetical protein
MTRIVCALLLTLTFPALAAPGELAQDRRELGSDRAELRDDVRDVEQAEALSREWQSARARRNGRALIGVELRVWDALLAELDESQREARRAARELRRSRREVNEERRELARDDAQARPVRHADDARDLRDDRRDHRDDRRDLERERRYHERIKVIEREWDTLVGARTPQAMNRKHALLGKLVQLARDEVRRTAEELREDRAERREDRRELREDRRERNDHR